MPSNPNMEHKRSDTMSDSDWPITNPGTPVRKADHVKKEDTERELATAELQSPRALSHKRRIANLATTIPAETASIDEVQRWLALLVNSRLILTTPTISDQGIGKTPYERLGLRRLYLSGRDLHEYGAKDFRSFIQRVSDAPSPLAVNIQFIAADIVEAREEKSLRPFWEAWDKLPRDGSNWFLLIIMIIGFFTSLRWLFSTIYHWVFGSA